MPTHSEDELLGIIEQLHAYNVRRNQQAVDQLTEALGSGHAHSNYYEHVITAQAKLHGPWGALLKRVENRPETVVSTELAMFIEEGTERVLRWSLSTSTSDVYRLMDRAELAAWQEFLYEAKRLV